MVTLSPVDFTDSLLLEHVVRADSFDDHGLIYDGVFHDDDLESMDDDSSNGSSSHDPEWLAVVLGDSADLVGEAVDILFNARDRRLSVDIMELSKVVVETSKFVTPRATVGAIPALADSPAAPGALATSAVVVKQELVQTPVSGVVVKVEGGAPSPSSASLMMPVMYPPRPVLASTTSSCGFKSPLIPNDGQKRIGAYTLEERRIRISKYLAKKSRRVWRKKIKYDCRKKLADNRPRIKGRFVKREEEEELEEHGAALQDDEELMTGLLSFDELLG